MANRKTKVNKIHYVDNAKFLEAMIEYKDEYNKAKEENADLPMISEYLGSVFLKIAQRLSFRPNFINYAFKNDMISDGIERTFMQICENICKSMQIHEHLKKSVIIYENL